MRNWKPGNSWSCDREPEEAEDEQLQRAADDPDFVTYLSELERRISDDVYLHSQRMRKKRLQESEEEESFDDEDVSGDLDEPETEVIYVRE